VAAAAGCGGGGAGKDAAWAGEGGVVFVDGTPVVPGSEEVVAFGFGLVDVGEFLDELADVGGGGVEEGEHRVGHLGCGDGGFAVGGHGVAEGGELCEVVL